MQYVSSLFRFTSSPKVFFSRTCTQGWILINYCLSSSKPSCVQCLIVFPSVVGDPHFIHNLDFSALSQDTSASFTLEFASVLGMTEEIPPHFLVGQGSAVSKTICLWSEIACFGCLCIRGTMQKQTTTTTTKNRTGQEQASHKVWNDKVPISG